MNTIEKTGNSLSVVLGGSEMNLRELQRHPWLKIRAEDSFRDNRTDQNIHLDITFKVEFDGSFRIRWRREIRNDLSEEERFRIEEVLWGSEQPGPPASGQETFSDSNEVMSLIKAHLRGFMYFIRGVSMHRPDEECMFLLDTSNYAYKNYDREISGLLTIIQSVIVSV